MLLIQFENDVFIGIYIDGTVVSKVATRRDTVDLTQFVMKL